LAWFCRHCHLEPGPSRPACFPVSGSSLNPKFRGDDNPLAEGRDGLRQDWMHRSFGAGSVSGEAAAWGREHGIRVIDGGCPLMFKPTADAGHSLIRVLLTLTGKGAGRPWVAEAA
jgi:hypothetical protein